MNVKLTSRPEGRTKTRTTTCGGCGETIHRCRTPDPRCNDCRTTERRQSSGRLPDPGRSFGQPKGDTHVTLRLLQLRRFYAGRLADIRRRVAEFEDEVGREPTPAERRRLERAMEWERKMVGKPTSVTDLPKPHAATVFCKMIDGRREERPADEPSHAEWREAEDETADITVELLVTAAC